MSRFWTWLKGLFQPHDSDFAYSAAEMVSPAQGAIVEAARSKNDDYDLERINKHRAKKGLPELTQKQALSAVSERRRESDDGFDTSHFLIGYMTGIPLPSSGGILGAIMHPGDGGTGSALQAPVEAPASYSAPDPAPAHEDSKSSYDGGGYSSNSGSSYSESSSGSSYSSGSDSGSFSSDSGGGSSSGGD